MTGLLNKKVGAGSSSGSVLIVVLWLLVLTGYLAGEYMMHNRAKAGTAIYAKEEFKVRLAIESLTDFFSIQNWTIPGFAYQQGTWMELKFDGIKLKVKVSGEKNRININTAPQNQLLNEIIKILGEDRAEEAPEIVDAILDWRDPDSLERTVGAETDYYSNLPSPYFPANGFFKTITELMLVRGVDSDLFWGDVSRFILNDSATEDEIEDEEPLLEVDTSFVNSFTIFSKEITRVTVVVPFNSKTYRLFILFFRKINKNRLSLIEDYTALLKVPNGE